MAAGTALYSGITAQAGTIYEAAYYTLRERPILARTITNLNDLSGMAPRKSQRYASVSFASHTDGADVDSSKMDPSVLATLTPAEYAARVKVTDQRAESDPENYVLNVGIELGAAAADYIDAYVGTVFASLTGGTITKAAGGTIGWSDVQAARAILAGNKVPGPYVLAVHPFQWRFLVNEAAGNGGAGITNAPALGDRLVGQSFFNTALFGDVLVVVSANVPGGASTAGTAALYAREAIALDIRRGFRLEPFRNPVAIATDYVASMVFAYGAWDAVRGVQLIGNASTPS